MYLPVMVLQEMDECSFSFLFPIQPENQPITVYLTLAVYLARGLASLSVRVLALSHSSSYSDSSAWSNTTGSEDRCISFSMTSSWFTYTISLRPFVWPPHDLPMTSSWPTYDLLMQPDQQGPVFLDPSFCPSLYQRSNCLATIKTHQVATADGVDVFVEGVFKELFKESLK